MRVGIGNIQTTEEHLAHVRSCVRREVEKLREKPEP